MPSLIKPKKHETKKYSRIKPNNTKSSGNILLINTKRESNGLTSVFFSIKYPQLNPHFEFYKRSMLVIKIDTIKRIDSARQLNPRIILKGVRNCSNLDISLQENLFSFS